MTLPSNSTYDEATVLNPPSAVTDFSLLVDLSRMSAAWWSAAEDTNKRRMRFAKGDGTELPFDPIEYDHALETGWARVKWSGTLAASGTQTLRVYPPVSTNAVYTDNNTYGKDNAYDSDWVNYWPFSTDTENRIVDGLEMIGQSGVPTPTISTVDGRVGLDFDGASALVSSANNHVYEATTVSLLKYARSGGGPMFFMCEGFNDYRITDAGYMHSNNSPRPQIDRFTNEEDYEDQWEHIGISTDTVTHADWYTDGVNDTTAPSGGNVLPWAPPANENRGVVELSLGSRNSGQRDYMNAALSHFSTHATDRPAAWMKQEADQVRDQAAFWGTWENVTAPSSGPVDDNYSDCLKRLVFMTKRN